MLFKKKQIDEMYWDTSISQSMLWKHSISGDLPILLINISSVEYMGMIDNVLSFIDYVKNRNLDIDIIIITDDKNYPDKVYDFVSKKLDNANYINETLGNVYKFRLDKLDKEDIELFKFVAKDEIYSVDDFLPKLNNSEVSLDVDLGIN